MTIISVKVSRHGVAVIDYNGLNVPHLGNSPRIVSYKPEVPKGRLATRFEKQALLGGVR